MLPLAEFDLFMVPLGTVFANYTFWVFVQDETVIMFTGDDINVEAEVVEVEIAVEE